MTSCHLGNKLQNLGSPSGPLQPLPWGRAGVHLPGGAQVPCRPSPAGGGVCPPHFSLIPCPAQPVSSPSQNLRSPDWLLFACFSRSSAVVSLLEQPYLTSEVTVVQDSVPGALTGNTVPLPVSCSALLYAPSKASPSDVVPGVCPGLLPAWASPSSRPGLAPTPRTPAARFPRSLSHLPAQLTRAWRPLSEISEVVCAADGLADSERGSLLRGYTSCAWPGGKSLLPFTTV